ncbi:unnamed protein product [Rotaria magnacalcarata]|uniref:Uncharacterized protein n=1 Tax=Rotaria magnacalcarata TaxID=392030 RepID=A0A816Q727_9BILA|nr:unnamed protein product [Rotaria magnacalcarata]CAF2057985.1 unnamed protein product [Rotaria magnacalcarata]CAF3736166.1 unnamed protein product [Rotaria magnacalcarata]CAF3759943.1 unnamed protein product [Rotaria magnacalcarata]
MGDEAKTPTKASIISYVENFIEKHDNELRTPDSDESDIQLPRTVDRDSIVIGTNAENLPRKNLDKNASEGTDIDADELNLESDPIVETREGHEQVYKQQVYLRQYQPPTPEPIDIQVHEVIVKPPVQREPIHVHVGPSQNRHTQRTPSPILIRSAPPQAPPLTSEPLVFHKYVPVDYQTLPQQIVIHRHPEMPPKPRPIVVEQWLPNKPAPKRVTYRHADHEAYAKEQFERAHNRFIEYKKPHTTIEVEIVRLPIVTLNPSEYADQSDELTQLDKVRSLTRDPNIIQWRI